MAKNKYIFVDLDETLIHCNLWIDEIREGESVITLDVPGKGEEYRALLRPGALDLLAELRKIAPCYILTASVQDYARAWNEKFNLGFENKDIYSREHIVNRHIDVSKFTDPAAYLIDNLPRQENRDKIQFLKMLDLFPKYYNIKAYHGFKNFDLKPKDIQRISNFVSE